MEPISLADELGVDSSTAIDFEITFAALVSATLLTSPDVSPLYPLAIATGILLLLVTLVRRMVLLNPISLDILDKTTPLLVAFTGFGLLYLSIVFATLTQPIIPLISIPVSTLSLVYITGFVVVSAVIYEILFRDFFLLIAVYAFNHHIPQRGTIVGRAALSMSQRALKFSALPFHKWPEEVQIIPSVEPVPVSEAPVEQRAIGVLGMIIGVVGFLLVFTFPLAVLYLLIPNHSLTIWIIGLLLGIGTNYLIVAMRFLYGRYGETPFRNITPPRRYIRLSFILYGLFFFHFIHEYEIHVL